MCYIISSVLCFCSFVVRFFLSSFHCEAIKPVTHNPDRSRPSSVKCVGHFGSVGAGGTQSNCSLEGKCDRASFPSTRRVRLPHPNRGGVQREGRREADGGGERKRSERGTERKAGGREPMWKNTGEVGVRTRWRAGERRLQRGNVLVDIIRVGWGAVSWASTPQHPSILSGACRLEAPRFWLHSGDSDLFHHHWAQGGSRGVEIYFLSLPVEHICTSADAGFKITKKHSLRISLICTHTSPGEERFTMCALFFSLLRQRYNWLCLTHKHSGNNPGFPLMLSSGAHSCARCWEQSLGSMRLQGCSLHTIAYSTRRLRHRRGRLTRKHLPVDYGDQADSYLTTSVEGKMKAIQMVWRLCEIVPATTEAIRNNRKIQETIKMNQMWSLSMHKSWTDITAYEQE